MVPVSTRNRRDPAQTILAQTDKLPDNYDVETSVHLHSLADVPDEVTSAPIEVYADDVLAARLNHYEREALLERNPGIRAAMKGEAARTKNEITRRRAGLIAAAERVFK